jgi:hypothetical protein
LDQEVAQERALAEPLAPSTATSRDTTAGDKPIRARGQHGRHKKYDDVHVIAQVGPSGEPLLPIEVLGKFNNQCSVIVQGKIEITYQDWKKVPKGLKQYVWEEMLKQFTYPEGSDLDKCRDQVMAVASKAL